MFVSLTALMASSHARWISNRRIARSVCALNAPTRSDAAVVSGSAAGTTPPQFLAHRFVALCTRFPMTSARSALWIRTRFCSEKGTSEPYAAVLVR